MSELDYDIEEFLKINNLSVNCRLFFDETNNVRIARIRQSDDMYRDMFFVLGGIGIKNDDIIDVTQIKQEICKNDNIEELKFSYLKDGQRGFTDILKSQKLLRFFHVLNDNEIYLHFHVLHYLHWGIVDILDSLFTEEDVNRTVYLENAGIFKSNFFEVLSKDYNTLIDLLCKYSFPNIDKNKVQFFIKDIYALYTTNFENFYNKMDIDNFYKETLRQMIKSKINKKELIFLEDNIPFEICNDLYLFYLQSMSVFKIDKKVFDKEDTIQNILHTKDKNFEVKLNVIFKNSKDDFRIQLSDCICGFLGALFKYLANNDEEKIVDFINSLDNDSIQIKNLKLFLNIYERSLNYSEFFVCRTIPVFVEYRFSLILDLIKKGR